MRVLGIDTSLRSTGIAVVEASGSSLRAVEYGHLPMRRTLLHSECLKGISEGIETIIARTSPSEAAIEGAFFCKNPKTAMILGEARGTAIVTCTRSDMSVYEYAPRRVKQAVVGVGSAGKNQVCQMVMRLLALTDPPQEDAADALALAICHLHSRRGIPGVDAKPV